MISLRKILTEKKWSVLLIYYILLFNLFFLGWAKNLAIDVKIYAWITCVVIGFAFSGISFFLKGKFEKIYLSIFFLLSIGPNIISWSYLYISDIYLQHDMYWVIFGSNISESKEYMSQFITPIMAVTTILYVIIGIFLLYKSGSKYALEIKKHKSLFISCIVLLMLFFSFQFFTKSVPTFGFYKSGIYYINESRKMRKEMESRKQLKIEATCTLSDSTKHVFVVVIGESLTRWHMQLYGYGRETTPLLESSKNELEIYTDVITPDTHTIGVLKKVLTFADNDHPEYYFSKPSIVELFKASGFETYWISNQEFISKRGGSYGIIAEGADHVYNLCVSQKHDEIVLPCLEKVLSDPVDKNKIIFIHLMGNHHAYDCRYPKEYEHFDSQKDGFANEKSYMDDESKSTLDKYDNSVLYSDFVVSSIISKVKAVSGSSFVLFFSDHGEEVFDTRSVRGHLMNNVYPVQCDIPFILWTSENYRKEQAKIMYVTDRSYSTEHIIYGISDLAGLKYKDYDPKLSIFSSEYIPPVKRMVGEENYEDILKLLK